MLLSFSMAQAIISIVPVELGKKPGVSGKLQGASERKRGNTDSVNYNVGLNLQYDNSTSYAVWSELTGSYGETNGEENTNKTYAHVRYIHTLYRKTWNWESFIQSETNKFTKVDRKYLAGGGLRYNLLGSQYGNLFFGLGSFGEKIKYTSLIDPDESNTRINSYIAYELKLGEDSKLAYVAYMQPKVNDFSDYIMSNAVSLKIHVYKKLFLSFIVFYDVDSKPAIGVKKTDYTQKTSFILEF